MTKKEYKEFSIVMLQLWMLNILTDGEYAKIMGRLNERLKGAEND